MREIPIKIGAHGPRVRVRETDVSDTWTLEWSGEAVDRYARRMLNAAETVVLRNNGERIVLTCPAE